MKRLKIVFSTIILATLILGLFFRAGGTDKKYESTEFLFDTYCTITAYSKNAETAVSAAFDEIARIHRLTNFFDENSDISRINKAKANEPIKVDPIVIEILETALEMDRESEGAFDVTLAPVSMLWKFDEGEPVPPTAEQIKTALAIVENGGIEVDAESLTVTKLSDETKLDLGGIAKGYAGDAAAKVLREMGAKAAIVDLGGNISCIGENPNSKDGKWRIGLQKPFAPTGEYSETVEINEASVVTSGTYQRYFEYGGEQYHHIIDPSTGQPSRHEFDSVTVVGGSSMQADCLATAVYVLGREKGAALAGKYGVDIYFN
ncbi:MAG: FAD:protein FMN transferase [Ruminococcaceae bacterium]|nr:FAD:protein FMN transferase [Oscillospiraceae bacterium]